MSRRTPTVWYKHLPPITEDVPTADGDRIVVISPGATLVSNGNRFSASLCRIEDDWDPRVGLVLALRRWRAHVHIDRPPIARSTAANRERAARVQHAVTVAQLYAISAFGLAAAGWTETPVVLQRPEFRMPPGAPPQPPEDSLKREANDPTRPAGFSSAEQAIAWAKKAGEDPRHLRRLAARYRREREDERAKRLTVEAKMAALRQSAGDAMRQWRADVRRLQGDIDDLGVRLSGSLETAGLARNRAEAAEAKLAEAESRLRVLTAAVGGARLDAAEPQPQRLDVRAEAVTVEVGRFLVEWHDHHGRVMLDGQEQKGVTRATITLDAREIPKITLDVLP